MPAPDFAEDKTIPTDRPWPLATARRLTEGRLHRPAIGLLELSTELVMQSEMRAFLPEGDSGLYSSRVDFGDCADIEGLSEMAARLSAATALLPDAAWLDAIVYGCTSGSMVIGPARVEALIGGARPGVPVFNPISAVVAGLKAMKRRRIAVVTPYPQEVNRMVGRFLGACGIEVVGAATFDFLSGYAMSRIQPHDLLAAAQQADDAAAEAIFISCTALRVSPVLEALEEISGKPVIASNQALAWQCCEHSGIRRSDGHGGALFNHRFEV